MVWCEELVHHVPLFVDLCEEYDQARYVYLPLRTVSGSWWCGVRNWSPCPTVCWPLWGIWSDQICLPTSKDSFWVLVVWCEELVHHIPLFVDLCEEYDQARYVYLPLRTVSGSWWCGVRNWSTISHCLLTSVRNMIRYQICLPTSKDSFWVLMVWCEELVTMSHCLLTSVRNMIRPDMSTYL